MKKTFHLSSISIVFQLLGVLINGVVGNSFEVLAHLIDSFGRKSSSIVFLQKLVIIILSQITIDWIFANNSMAVDMTLWIVEKNYKTIWVGIQMWMTVGNILTLVKITNLRMEIMNLFFTIFIFQKNYQDELILTNKNSFVKKDCS